MRKTVRIALAVVAVILILFAAWRLLGIYLDYREGTDTYDDVISDVVIETEPRPPESETIPEEEKKPAAPIDIDFAALQKINPDVIGWIYCPDTPIHYPIVKRDDNTFYLDHMVDGTQNAAGTLFADYACADDFSDPNTVIYGHNMKNDSMFGTLPEYTQQAYYDAHPLLWVLTPDGAYTAEPLGGTVTPADSDAYEITKTPESLQSYAQRVMERSGFRTQADTAQISRLLTLSTCSYEYQNARFVLVCKLTKVS